MKYPFWALVVRGKTTDGKDFMAYLSLQLLALAEKSGPHELDRFIKSELAAYKPASWKVVDLKPIEA